MMKTKKSKLALTLFFGLSSVAHAGTVSCDGDATVPSQYITGTCNAGFCSASIPGSEVSVSGSCSTGSQTFSASAYFSPGFFQGNCNGGFLTGMLNGGDLDFSGSCSEGGTFSGSGYASMSSVTGTCQKDGFFSVMAPMSSVTVSGSCASTAEN